MRFVLLVCCLSFLFQTQAQSQKRRAAPYNSFGFDGTGVLKSVLAIDAEHSPTHTLVWKKALTEKKGWRIGLSFLIDEIKENASDNFNFRNINRQQLAFRYGREYFYWLNNHFHFFYGWDVLVGLNRENSLVNDFSFGQVSVTQTQWNAGLGPVIGLEYQFSKLFKMGVESTVYFIYENGNRKITDSSGQDFETKVTGYTFRHVLPQSLYLYIMF